MRIRQEGIFLSQLVKEVTRGQLVPAAFQRPYVWTQKDVLAFCESLLEGFPIGSFLTWEPGPKVDLSMAGRRRIGPLTPADTNKAQALLLDGQNRLATVAWMMRADDTPVPDDLSPAEAQTWNAGERLVVDLELQRIMFVPEAEADKGFRLPSRVLFGALDTNKLLRERWDLHWGGYSEAVKDKGVRWYDKLTDSFRDAKVVQTTMERATLEEAKRAFLLICKVGAPMTEADFDAAVAWAPRDA